MKRMTPERFAELSRLPADCRQGPERELWEALVAERAELHAMETALRGLLKFHVEDDGEPVPRKYWTPEYRAAVEQAEAALPGAELNMICGACRP